MSQFEPETYSHYRPLYPAKIFSPLVPFKKTVRDVVDLGAGTGYSLKSFLEWFPDVAATLVEPDPAMLAQAKIHLKENLQVKKFQVAPAEDFTLESSSQDLVLIGSAWHWMDSSRVIPKLKQILRDQGIVHIFEYQFPKSTDSDELNEWMRRQFNLHWKAPAQTPRGKLKELVQPLRSDKQFKCISEIGFDHQAEIDLESFAGILFSQSRFLHFEKTLNSEDQKKYRSELKSILQQWFPFPWGSLPFFYRMNAFTFRFFKA